ncbi:hypothetical protein DFP72DRAFT_924666 [Ephemerocybe angulata]|uniref:Uncharacterized protein n=1 Tax=Ephemerocybe angulata TaxID=980116 RepID=A0A8H6HH37_9AGAR|nr:hypothetical protein DFP72DRAFT_924666 [Tulosesus angulatus]
MSAKAAFTDFSLSAQATYLLFQIVQNLAYSHSTRFNPRRLEAALHAVWALILESLLPRSIDGTSRTTCVAQLPITTAPTLDMVDPNDSLASEFLRNKSYRTCIPDFTGMHITSRLRPPPFPSLLAPLTLKDFRAKITEDVQRDYVMPPGKAVDFKVPYGFQAVDLNDPEQSPLLVDHSIVNWGALKICAYSTLFHAELKRPPSRRIDSSQQFYHELTTLLIKASVSAKIQASFIFKAEKHTNFIISILSAGEWWQFGIMKREGYNGTFAPKEKENKDDFKFLDEVDPELIPLGGPGRLYAQNMVFQPPEVQDKAMKKKKPRQPGPVITSSDPPISNEEELLSETSRAQYGAQEQEPVARNPGDSRDEEIVMAYLTGANDDTDDDCSDFDDASGGEAEDGTLTMPDAGPDSSRTAFFDVDDDNQGGSSSRKDSSTPKSGKKKSKFVQALRGLKGKGGSGDPGGSSSRKPVKDKKTVHRWLRLTRTGDSRRPGPPVESLPVVKLRDALPELDTFSPPILLGSLASNQRFYLIQKLLEIEHIRLSKEYSNILDVGSQFPVPPPRTPPPVPPKP